MLSYDPDFLYIITSVTFKCALFLKMTHSLTHSLTHPVYDGAFPVSVGTPQQEHQASEAPAEPVHHCISEGLPALPSMRAGLVCVHRQHGI